MTYTRRLNGQIIRDVIQVMRHGKHISGDVINIMPYTGFPVEGGTGADLEIILAFLAAGVNALKVSVQKCQKLSKTSPKLTKTGPKMS